MLSMRGSQQGVGHGFCEEGFPVFSMIKSRMSKLHREQKGIETLQAVGLAFVGVLILLALFYFFVQARKSTTDQTNTLIQLNYKSASPEAKQGGGNVKFDE
jgi:hypothetical protein